MVDPITYNRKQAYAKAGLAIQEAMSRALYGEEDEIYCEDLKMAKELLSEALIREQTSS